MTLDELIAHIPGSRGAVDISIIEDLESELDEGLPVAYKDFLRSCKGGLVNKDVWFRSSLNSPPGNFCIAVVLGEAADCYLTNAREDYWGRIPEELRPMMSDPYGNQVCIGVSGRARGKVYVWLHEKEATQGAEERSLHDAVNVELVATSFEEFIANLTHETAA